MNEIIVVSNLTKKFGPLTAVDDISFAVQEGALFAFLGPNGAGKSTTINIICTLLQKTDGEVVVAGYTVGKQDPHVRKRIGVVFQDNVLDDLLTVRENLLMRGALYGFSGKALHRQLDHVCSVMDLGEIAHRRFGKLSGGQKRRAEIGRALMNNPQILFLDEPTTGLDPQTRILVWQNVKSLQKELNMTVFLTTHYMEEAAGADAVAVIDGGKIAAQGTPHQLKQQYSTDVLKIAPRNLPDLLARVGQQGLACQQEGDTLHVFVNNSLQAFALLKEWEGGFDAFELVRGSMDDVFVNITGHRIREDA